ncbi:FmdB family zinc ribbon protein [Brachybacterium huguangmaarense]
MPTYVYACKNCGHRFEQRQSFTDDALVTCPACGQDALRKVYDSVGVVFKGPGFYSTDSASGSGTSSTAASPAATTDGASGTATSTSSSSGASTTTPGTTASSTD